MAVWARLYYLGRWGRCLLVNEERVASQVVALGHEVGHSDGLLQLLRELVWLHGLHFIHSDIPEARNHCDGGLGVAPL